MSIEKISIKCSIILLNEVRLIVTSQYCLKLRIKGQKSYGLIIMICQKIQLLMFSANRKTKQGLPIAHDQSRVSCLHNLSSYDKLILEQIEEKCEFHNATLLSDQGKYQIIQKLKQDPSASIDELIQEKAWQKFRPHFTYGEDQVKDFTEFLVDQDHQVSLIEETVLSLKRQFKDCANSVRNLNTSINNPQNRQHEVSHHLNYQLDTVSLPQTPMEVQEDYHMDSQSFPSMRQQSVDVREQQLLIEQNYLKNYYDRSIINSNPEIVKKIPTPKDFWKKIKNTLKDKVVRNLRPTNRSFTRNLGLSPDQQNELFRVEMQLFLVHLQTLRINQITRSYQLYPFWRELFQSKRLENQIEKDILRNKRQSRKAMLRSYIDTWKIYQNVFNQKIQQKLSPYRQKKFSSTDMKTKRQFNISTWPTKKKIKRSKNIQRVQQLI